MAFRSTLRTLKFKVLGTTFAAVFVAVAIEAAATHYLSSQAFATATRVNLTTQLSSALHRLETFNAQQWRELKALAIHVEAALAARDGLRIDHALDNAFRANTYFSEIFVMDFQGRVLHSSARDGVGNIVARKAALRALEAGAETILDGPYLDPRTDRLGATTSKFHDAVTVMYFARIESEPRLFIGGRLPNDVLGDVLQQDRAHIYRSSGDTYLFALRGNDTVAPGTALTRSRFEDTSAVPGPNLKDGIFSEDFAPVKVQKTSELELVLRDPVSKTFIFSVEQVMAQGESATYDSDGYTDYRHVPVVGVGTTVQLEGAPDVWGLVAQADVAEAFAPVKAGDRWSLLALVSTTILGTMMVALVVVKPMDDLTKVTEKIHETASSVHNASQAVGRSAGSLAMSATDQASAIAQTMASMEQITAMVAANSEAARQAYDRAQHNASDAALGLSVVTDVQSAMRAISEQNNELARVVEIIENIRDKTKVIHDIVFETKLLSFNASIEAARAGEQGRGFAVVAEEIGNLARLSGKAAQEISALIEQSTKQVHTMVRVTKDTITEGIQVTERAKLAFDSISNGVKNVSQVMDQVALSSQEQQQGISQVSRAMAQMDSLTQNTAAASADASMQSADLKGAGEHLRDVVTELEGLVGAVWRRRDTVTAPSPRVSRSAEDRREANDGDYDVEQAGIESLPKHNDGTFG